MTANECYKIHRDKIDELISKLQSDLLEMDDRQASDPDSWGFAGNAGHIKNELHQLCRTAKES